MGMHAAKPILCWIIILCCWQEIQVVPPAISTPNRSRVALAGENLDFNLSLVVKANDTSKVECYRTQNKQKILVIDVISRFVDVNYTVTASIPRLNSSSSGNYYFRYAHQYVHWVVHVRDKGYEEPPDEVDSEIITMMAFSGILLMLNVLGSFYILKSYKDWYSANKDMEQSQKKPSDNKIKQRSCGDERNEGEEQRPVESNNVIMDEDDGSASLYTALQYKSHSIYDTLDPEIMADEGNSRKSDMKDCKGQEDEVFDSVYENL